MIPKFTYLNPDQNNYKHNLKDLKDWDVKEVVCTTKTSYWIAEHPFKTNYDFTVFRDLVSKYPVCKGNNDEADNNPNPFQTIHIPSWMSMPICDLVRNYYLSTFNPHVKNPRFMEWGNLYEKNKARPIDAYRIPHIDAERGFICNLWFSYHNDNTSGTEIYEYKGKMIDNLYDFMVDESHPKYKEWKNKNLNARLDSWKNLSSHEAEYWGFEKVGFSASKEGTVTMYTANTCHRPFVSQSVDFRWSHTFSFMHENGDTLGSLF